MATCTELTCPHHGEANRAALDAQRAAERKGCEWFVWVGQPYSSCDRCGRPAWKHLGEETYRRAAGPFTKTEPVGKPWEPGQADKIKEKWGGQ